MKQFYGVRNLILFHESSQIKLGLTSINFYLKMDMIFVQELLFSRHWKIDYFGQLQNNKQCLLGIKVQSAGYI